MVDIENNIPIPTGKNDFVDISGQKFNFLTAIEYKGRCKSNKPLWLFKCDCGNTRVLRGPNVRSGQTISCGCYMKNKIEQAQDKYNG